MSLPLLHSDNFKSIITVIITKYIPCVEIRAEVDCLEPPSQQFQLSRLSLQNRIVKITNVLVSTVAMV